MRASDVAQRSAGSDGGGATHAVAEGAAFVGGAALATIGASGPIGVPTGTVHASFMDFKRTVELLEIDVPRDGVNGSLRSMEPDRMRAVVGGAVTRFFDSQLRGGPAGQVSDFAQTLPEVTFEHR